MPPDHQGNGNKVNTWQKKDNCECNSGYVTTSNLSCIMTNSESLAPFSSEARIVVKMLLELVRKSKVCGIRKRRFLIQQRQQPQWFLYPVEARQRMIEANSYY
jgi:hypothetical protein